MGSSSRGLEFLDNAAEWRGTNEFSTLLPATILKLLGNPQDQIQSIHVAGTNGKGSVCAILAAMFHAAGNRVGQFTSPHLTEVFERCLVNGQPVTKSVFAESLDQMIDSAKDAQLAPSYFEAVAIATFLTFAREKIDWGMIEVGLGGRLDATNTIKAPAATVITSIGYDHMHILGDTLPLIAKEKLGILRPSVPLFVGANMNSEVRQVILKAADKAKAPCFFLDDELITQRHPKLDKIDFNNLSLLGKHQEANARLAALVALHLGLTIKQIEEGLKIARWPGRLEKLPLPDCKSSEIIIDAAHNADGIKTLTNFLGDYFLKVQTDNRPVLVFGFLERKDWKHMLNQLKSFEDTLLKENGKIPNWIFSCFNNDQSVDPKKVIEHFGRGTASSSAEEALEQATTLAKYEKSTILFAGSIFFISEIRQILTKKPFTTIQK